jgi:hypothetical protein
VKGIGVFVAILLVAGGVAMYVYTRPPDRDLDAQGRTWVGQFESWSADMARNVDRAEVSIGVSQGKRLDASLVPALEVCSRTLAELGEPPVLLERVHEEAGTACGELEYALSLNDGYGPSALASTRLHLQRAARWLVAADYTLTRALGSNES